jgi:hypothetical protein
MNMKIHVLIWLMLTYFECAFDPKKVHNLKNFFGKKKFFIV